MPAVLAAMDEPRRNLTLALAASLLLHAALLAIHFTPPDFMEKAREQALEVILVNSKSKTRPNKAQAKAQTNLDGGGNTDEDRRAKTPLPPSARTKEGDRLIEAQRRVAELEAQTQAQMTQLKSARTVNVDKSKVNPVPVPAPEPNLSGADLASSALAIARLEGQIARQLEEYNQRPRKKFIGARVSEYRFAQYVEDWRQKIERVGNLNYPDAAKGRHYGSLTLSVIIKANGDLKQVEVIRSSGQTVLDDAARRIVRMSAPFAAFPESIRRDTDELDITRTWTFTNSDRLQAD